MPHLPLVTRAEEEAAMHVVYPGEIPCRSAEQCMGFSLPGATGGGLLPEFRSFHYCVICLRARTLAAWLDQLGAPKTDIIQPYRVSIGPGEYSLEACIEPFTRRFDGITDPYPRFVAERLVWEQYGTLKQVNMAFTIQRSLRDPGIPPKQFMMHSLPILDISWPLLKKSGLFTHYEPTDNDPIVHAIRFALWGQCSLTVGSWVQSLAAWLKISNVTRNVAVCVVQHTIVQVLSKEPLLVVELRKRHDWDAFVKHSHDNMQRVQRNKDVIKKKLKMLNPNQEFLFDRLLRLSHRRHPAKREEEKKEVEEEEENDNYQHHTDKMLKLDLKKWQPRLARHQAEIRSVDLPDHWFRFTRSDLVDQFVCMKCQSFKGYVAETRVKPVYGQQNVGFDLIHSRFECYKKRPGGRLGENEEIKVCGELKQIQVAGKMIELFGQLYHASVFFW